MKLQLAVAHRLVFSVRISVVARIMDVITNGTKLKTVLMMKMKKAVILNIMMTSNDTFVMA